MLSTCTLLLEFLLLTATKTEVGQQRSDILISVMIVLFSIVFLYEIFHSRTTRHYAAPITFGYLFRLALLYWDIYGKEIYGLPNSGADSVVFFKVAVSFSNGFDVSWATAFTKPIGWVFSAIGISSLFAQFLILICSMVAIIFAIKSLTYIVADNQTRRISIYLLCLLPDFAILSAILLREAVIAMLISISVYCFLKWFYTKDSVAFILAFALVFVASRFHSGVVGAAVGYIVIRFFYDRRRRRFRISAAGVIAAIILVLVFAFLYLNYSDKFFSYMRGIESIEDIAEGGEGEGGSTYAQYVGDSSTPLRMIIFTIPRMVYFMFSPFPWQWRGLSDIIAFCFSAMFYLWTVVRSLRYLRSGSPENRGAVIALGVVALCTWFIYAWGVSNTGTATRHRDKMVVLYAILWCATKIPKTERREMMP